MKQVYFIKPIGMDGPFKIGCSSTPECRRRSLETWAPFPLEVVATIEGGFDLERRFHAMFKASHSHREWFRSTPELLSVIEAIKKGAFNPEDLPEPMMVSHLRDGKPKRWSDESRLRLSYSLRITLMEKRTGFSMPRNRRAPFETERPRMDAYLAAPHVHGVPIRAPWAAAKIRAFMASYSTPNKKSEAA